MGATVPQALGAGRSRKVFVREVLNAIFSCTLVRLPEKSAAEVREALLLHALHWSRPHAKSASALAKVRAAMVHGKDVEF